MRLKKKLRTLLILGITGFSFILGGCVSSGSSTTPDAPQVTEQDVIRNYANIVYASYSDALTRAKKMHTALEKFVAAPSASTMESAKNAWKAARIPYGQTEVYRFYAGPIDDDNGPEGQLNAWPMDESYVDYVSGKMDSGIVNDPSVSITKEMLKSLNEEGGEENVATGYHAIEFLLWGQDLNGDGPGARPYTDYVSGEMATAKHAERRGQYLLTVSEILVEDLEYLTQAWEPAKSNNYRSQFLKQNPKESLRQILTGMGSLSKGELAGERMAVALESRDQEDEHSCFSDNTHVDIIQNAKGIHNVFMGHYQRSDGPVVSGPGIKDLLNAKLRSQVTQEMDDTMSQVYGIEAPFDRAIIDPPQVQQVKTAIEALRTQADSILVVAQALGIQNVQVELPE